MEHAALQLLTDNAIDANIRRVPDGIDAIALPQHYTLVDLEKQRPGRRRFRGSLATADLENFAEYVKVHGAALQGIKPAGFINADELSAKVFFNLQTTDGPGHADHTATLKLKPTAAYTALLAINGDRNDQRDLVDWLEDWSHALQPFAGNGEAYEGSLAKAVSAIRVMKLKEVKESETTVGDFRGTRSTMEDVEASSRVELPAGFYFTCQPYLGLPSRAFKLRLSVLTSAREPTLVLRIVQLEAEQEAIAKDFKDVLAKAIAENASLTIGTFTA